MTGQVHHFSVGTFKCLIISEGERAVSIQKAFNVSDDEMTTTQAQWHGLLDNAAFGMNVLYIDTGAARVLIDSGRGAASGEDATVHTLAAQGVAPDTITDVILTHCHWDHLAGVIDPDGHLTYPNARYWIGRTEWQDWTDEAFLAARDENNAAHARRVLGASRERVTLIDHEDEFLPAFRLIPAPGHTRGQVAVRVESQGRIFWSLADALHQPIQIVRPQWSPAFDMLPDLSPTTRLTLLRRVAAENALITAAHFPFPALGSVRAEGDALAWEAL
jgi:glyoxylase-like metal-dependent hydrolase (beta-lactamase superfamily II)